jgi:hypothetical protein
MKYGDGFPPEMLNQLRADFFICEFDERNPSWSDTREEIGIQLQDLVARSVTSGRKIRGAAHHDAARQLVLEDWAARSKSARRLAEPRPRQFARLIHGEGAETLRKLLNRARALWAGRFGFSRKEFQLLFLRITTSARFPKSPDDQIEFLARSFAAAAVGYQPSTGYRKLADIVEWCHFCRKRPAIVDVELESRQGLLPWCAACTLCIKAMRR